MTDPRFTHEQIIAAETATEILTSAQGILSERLNELHASDVATRSRIEAKARDLYRLQQSIRVEDEAAVRAIIATWGLRVRDEDRFWREV